MKRPPAGVRVAVLVAAVACLGLTMCARTQKPPPNPPAQQQVQGSDGSGSCEGGCGTQMQLEEGDMAKRKPTYFPASKAPGGMYQQR
jgi:hypothetical protein